VIISVVFGPTPALFAVYMTEIALGLQSCISIFPIPEDVEEFKFKFQVVVDESKTRVGVGIVVW
jgi:hypothetical protein